MIEFDVEKFLLFYKDKEYYFQYIRTHLFVENKTFRESISRIYCDKCYTSFLDCMSYNNELYKFTCNEIIIKKLLE